MAKASRRYKELLKEQKRSTSDSKQSRISDLTRGRVDLFSIDTLVNMLATAGLYIAKAA